MTNNTQLDRAALLAIRPLPPKKIQLPQGYLLMKHPTGETHREWRRLLRNEDGTVNNERFDISDELMLMMLLIDTDGNQMFTLEDVAENRVFDSMPAPLLKRLKDEADAMQSSLSDDDRGNDSSDPSSNES